MKKIIVPFLFVIYILAFTLNSSAHTDDSFKIYLDPGHGGYDGGAVVGEYTEADLNLVIAKSIGEVLEKNHYKVYYTRESDVDLSTDTSFNKRSDLKNRTALINNSDCDMFLSIHLNKFPQSIYKGAQVFYYNNNSSNEYIASLVQNSCKNMLDSTRSIKKIDSVYLLKNVKKPGCLIECGFMSNEDELNLLLTKDYQLKIGFTILDALDNYIINL